jgi:hypothetical protein
MALAQFSKAGVTSVVFSRGPLYPTEHIHRPRQLKGVSDSGRFQVATIGITEERLPLAFSLLPTVDRDAILAFLQHPLVNWSAEPFTYTDPGGQAYTVRFVDDELASTEVGPGLYNLTLTLRLEM